MKNLFNPPKKVVMSLVGLDGNAFSLMGAFAASARLQGWTKEEVDVVITACKSSNYDNLLQVLIEHTTEEGLDDDEEDY
jgi:ABC-type uncharacterized transport system permease subunit